MIRVSRPKGTVEKLSVNGLIVPHMATPIDSEYMRLYIVMRVVDDDLTYCFFG